TRRSSDLNKLNVNIQRSEDTSNYPLLLDVFSCCILRNTSQHYLTINEDNCILKINPMNLVGIGGFEMKTVDNITELIGETPIMKLNKTEDNSVNIVVKLEYYNPESSVKDRIALVMVNEAEQKGVIKPGDTIVEPTSGNTGIGLALVAAAKGYKLVVVMPDTISQERRN